MNQAILTPEVQAFLHKHIQEKPADLALRKSPFHDVSSAELAAQLDGLRRSQKKLALWHGTPGIYFPSLLAIEQTSSALTAQYKSRLVPEDCSLIDLTGGFGVDSYYFSDVAKEVVHCERNEDLSQIAAHNARVLQSENIKFIASDGLAYLKENPTSFDVIYIDPSRRVQQQKVFRLSDCEPNVVEKLSFLLANTSRLIIKAAPLLDIKAALSELEHVKEIHIVSVQNECKELLFILEAAHTTPPNYYCVALSEKEAVRQFVFSEQQEVNSYPVYSSPLLYLYEPDAALLKGGCFKSIAIFYNLKKLHPHTHLYTSETLNTSFIGRVFKVISTVSYSDFKKNKTPITANVSSRNFPLKPEELKKKHRIKDGGDSYLFFCTGPNDELLVVNCKKEMLT